MSRWPAMVPQPADRLAGADPGYHASLFGSPTRPRENRAELSRTEDLVVVAPSH